MKQPWILSCYTSILCKIFLVIKVLEEIMVTSRGHLLKLGMQLEADPRVRPIISPGTAKKLSKHHCNV